MIQSTVLKQEDQYHAQNLTVSHMCSMHQQAYGWPIVSIPLIAGSIWMKEIRLACVPRLCTRARFDLLAGNLVYIALSITFDGALCTTLPCVYLVLEEILHQAHARTASIML